MGIKLIRFFSFLAAISILVYSCVNNTEESVNKEEDSVIIRLRWFPGSFDQSNEEVKTGFAWTLSSLGALLPVGSMDKVMTELDENLFEINLSRAGFTEEALEALRTIVSRMKSSNAYEANNYIEMGRFVMLTLNSSNHYYKITQASRTIDEFRSTYAFNGTQMRLIKSSISITPRLIEIAEASRYEEIAYIAEEGAGSFEDETFEAKEFEVFNFMPNGQLQFAIYDVNGRLKEAADDSFTIAGKLAKCLWCHETSIQPLFQENPVLEGDTFLSEEDFSILRDKQNLYLAEYRSSLQSDIDLFNLQDHRFQEYLYIDFMEPTIERIAIEWGMGIDEVALVLAEVSGHTQSEYNIENVYDRNEIEQYAPYTSLEVPESAREFSENEPNFFIF